MISWIAQALCTVFSIVMFMAGTVSIYDFFFNNASPMLGIMGVLMLCAAFAFTVLAAEFMQY